ncbi:MAG TPA: hypothetical protein V6D06_01020 [Trichocoleus sp.]
MNWLYLPEQQTDAAGSACPHPSQKDAPKRIKSRHYQFSYRFTTGHLLVGSVLGDVILNLPDLVFNLRQLSAVLRDKNGRTVAQFDRVFGQFKLGQPEILLSGSDARSGAFFCFNYRGSEAVVFDSASNLLASGWQPETWQVE